MVLLNDAQTNVVIPYASVWGNHHGGQRDNRSTRALLADDLPGTWAPHYGNDVVLPGTGTYQLSLLISAAGLRPATSKYQGVWLKPHTVTFTFPLAPGPS